MKTTSKLLSALALVGLLTIATPADAKTHSTKSKATASKASKAVKTRIGQLTPTNAPEAVFGSVIDPDSDAEAAWRAKSGGAFTIRNGICYSDTVKNPDVFDLPIPNSVVYKGKCYTAQGLAQELEAERGKPTPEQLAKQNQLLKQCDGKCTFSGVNKIDGTVTYLGSIGNQTVAGTISYNGQDNQLTGPKPSGDVYPAEPSVQGF